MGDFNMAFFMVVPEMRSRGVKIDLAAWYPWKLADGTACADSCGIFFVNLPGQYLLETGPECLHADNEKGFFWEKPAVAGKERYPVFDKNTGPGFPLCHFLPKINVQPKVRESLTPTLTGQELEAEGAVGRVQSSGKTYG